MQCRPVHHRTEHSGFTLLELLLALAIMGTLYTVSFGNVLGVFDKVYNAKMNTELKQLMQSFQRYAAENGGNWPADAAAGVLPTGMDEYMVTGNWPVPPWDGSTYDWDNFDAGGTTVHQVAVRFCDSAPAVNCTFPGTEWAEGWTTFHNSYYICVDGPCRASQADPAAVGYCVNCATH